MQATFSQYGITLPNGARGNVKAVCPKCPPHKKASSNRDKDLSVNVEEGVWNCHRCNWSGYLPKTQKKEYVKPLPRLEKVSPKVIEYFEGRGISNDTLLRTKITEAKEWMPQFDKEVETICFNYFRGEELLNIKFRGPKKSFKLAKDAELVFYNLNGITGTPTAIIVEGEIDCLSLIECGVYNVVSVPNGASKGSQKLEYLDNCWQFFEGKEKIIIAVDGDEAGASLKEELARRLGKERCATVHYPEGCKDANEVLLNHGKESLKALIAGAVDWPLEGIVSMDEIEQEVADYYLNGYPEGAKAKIPGFDDLLSFMPGQLTVITGIPGSGKDEFFNKVMVNLSMYENWTWGIWEAEEPAAYHVTKLVEKVNDKSFAFRRDQNHRVSADELQFGLILIRRYFHFIDIGVAGTSIDDALNKMEELVKRYGINGFVINPWNCIDHLIPQGWSETQYVSFVLTKIINAAKKCNVHIFLVAHPTKIQKNKQTGKYEIPTLYSISGSANFFNKTHNGICVYRDFETNIVDVYVQKVKWSWLGKIGYASFSFNTDTRQYIPLIN
jgi:twinkle protein